MKSMLWFVTLTCALTALSVTGFVVTRAADAVPRFIPGPCPAMPQPIPALKEARCGRLLVPEDRARPGGRTISLSVAIVKSAAAQAKPDPIVWLAGGPGDDAITEIPMALAGKLNADRDVIFMSQRGTYSAVPKLTCEQVDRWPEKTLDMPYDAAATGTAYLDATVACLKEMAGKTSDLPAYNTLESAADYDDLRTALHIDTWNVYGISYGTDLALTYVKTHPAGIRSVAIDGVFPPQIAGGVSSWASAGEGINAVFAACRAQAACSKRYGDIGATFRRLVIEYEAAPKTVSVAVPGHAGKVKVKISGGMLLQWAVSPGTHLAAKVPAAFYALAHGDPAPIASTWAIPKLDPNGIGVLSNGLFYGVACAEWVPYETEQSVVAAGRRAFPTFPMSILRNAPNLPFMRQNCHVWNVPPAPPLVREATRSNLPTLVVNAQYDGQTAASFGALVARTLPNATVVTIPNIAHVAYGSPSADANKCAYAIADSFFNRLNGADTSCIKRVPPTKFDL
jgi:pimeloyl-ACP methyl ester carboxylesterase